MLLKMEFVSEGHSDKKVRARSIRKREVKRKTRRQKINPPKQIVAEAQKKSPTLDSVVATIKESDAPLSEEIKVKEEPKDIQAEKNLTQETKPKGEIEPQKMPHYKKIGNDYDSGSYIAELKAGEDELPPHTVPIHPSDDLEVYKLKKDMDIIERIKGRGLPVPWQNEFLNYLKDKINHTAGRLYSIAKKGYDSTLHYPHAAYSSIYHLLHKKR